MCFVCGLKQDACPLKWGRAMTGAHVQGMAGACQGELSSHTAVQTHVLWLRHAVNEKLNAAGLSAPSHFGFPLSIFIPRHFSALDTAWCPSVSFRLEMAHLTEQSC